MTTENVNIRFTVRGVRTVRNGLRNVEQGSERTARSVGRLNLALGAIGSAVALQELQRFADTAIRIENQLRLVSISTENQNRLFEEQFQIARDTRSSLEDVNSLYFRLQRSTVQLGVSQQELTELTRGVSQAFTVFGASAEEQSAAIIQFSQGLAAGALRGDELRSVLEQAPRLAQAIADGLNEIGGVGDLTQVALGDLRDLGRQGLLTTENVVRAIQTQFDAIQEEFERTRPTIQQGFQQLQNSVIRTFRENQDVFTPFARGLIFLADNFDILSRGAIALAGVLSTVLIRQIFAVSRALTVLAFTNPFTALAAVITAATSTLIAFGDEITVIENESITLRDILVGTFNIAREGASALLDTVIELGRDGLSSAQQAFAGFGVTGAEVTQAITVALSIVLELTDRVANFFATGFGPAINAAQGQFGSFGQTLEDLVNVARTVVNRIIGFFRGLGNVVALIFNEFLREPIRAFAEGTVEALVVLRDFAAPIFGNIADGAQDAARQIATLLNQSVQGIDGGDFGGRVRDAFVEGLNSDTVGDLSDFVAGSLTQLGDGIADFTNTALENQSAEVEELLGVLDRARESVLNAARDARDTRLASQQNIGELGTFGPGATGGGSAGGVGFDGLTSEQREARLALLGEVEDGLRDEAEALRLVGREREDLQAIIEAEEDLRRRLRQSDLELTDQQIIQLSELAEAERDAIVELNRRNQQIAENAALIERSFQSAEDTLVEFATTGQASFGDLVNSIIDDLTRLAIQRSIIQPLEGLFNAGGGAENPLGGLRNVGSSLLGFLPGFATGGSFRVGGNGGLDQNLLSVNGNPVARVSRGETVSVSPPGTTNTSGGVNVTVNINGVQDADSFQRSRGQIEASIARALAEANRRNG